MGDKDEIAALKKKVEALEAAQPKPAPRMPTTEEIAAHQDEVHRMREGRANSWMPPNAVQEMIAAEPPGMMRDVALRDARAPTSPSTIPRTEGASNDRAPMPSSTPGYVDPRPLSNPPGTNWVDAIAIADEVRQRKEKK